MKKKGFQEILDSVIKKLFLWAVPNSITPNQVTFVRFITVPFVWFLLANHNYKLGILLFFFSACTDFIDGAMARTRDQITNVGKVIDPIADKLLIGAALAAVGFKYLIVKIFLVFIGIEILSSLTGAYLTKRFNKPAGANIFGKIKMVLQTISVFLLIIGLILNRDTIIENATYILYIALMFAVLSAYGQIERQIAHTLKSLK